MAYSNKLNKRVRKPKNKAIIKHANEAISAILASSEPGESSSSPDKIEKTNIKNVNTRNPPAKKPRISNNIIYERAFFNVEN